MASPHQRLLHLRALALRNARIGYEPHRERIERHAARISKVGLHEADINWLAWHYRRQISPELVPYVAAPAWMPAPAVGRRG